MYAPQVQRRLRGQVKPKDLAHGRDLCADCRPVAGHAASADDGGRPRGNRGGAYDRKGKCLGSPERTCIRQAWLVRYSARSQITLVETSRHTAPLNAVATRPSNCWASGAPSQAHINPTTGTSGYNSADWNPQCRAWSSVRNALREGRQYPGSGKP